MPALCPLWASSAWSNTRQLWQADADKRSTGQAATSFTDVYLADRAAMLSRLIQGNLANSAQNADGYMTVAGSTPDNLVNRYTDYGPATGKIDVTPDRLVRSGAPKKAITFGVGLDDLLFHFQIIREREGEATTVQTYG